MIFVSNNWTLSAPSNQFWSCSGRTEKGKILWNPNFNLGKTVVRFRWNGWIRFHL